jgi:hypothetical protein
MITYHCVVDQFLISVISGITFESLALGRRLISRDDGTENAVFFGEPPPILSAGNVDEIADRMRQVIADPDDNSGVGEKCALWVSKYHSALRITGLQLDAFENVLKNRKVPSVAKGLHQSKSFWARVSSRFNRQRSL